MDGPLVVVKLCMFMSRCTVATFIIISGGPLQAQLSVTSLPDLMFGKVDATKVIVEGTAVLLYCEVNSRAATLMVTWNMDGERVVQNLPHIRLRTFTSTNSVTLRLWLDYFGTSSVGIYQCTAQDGQEIAKGTSLRLTGICMYKILSCNEQSP